jgi:hypothetical protein
MSYGYDKINAIVLASIMILQLALPAQALSVPSVGRNNAASSASAQLTEAHGTIFKRSFVDWTKQLWGDPEPAKVGDMLKEGMQLGTGDKSWAQVTWPNVTTRAWSNTVFAVAPNQKLVYLLGGEMLFNLDKHRKDKSEYIVWTKVLQARIRGTTVLVQSGADSSRISVLEGTIDVMNRIDHSVIRINPGVVYEINHLTGLVTPHSSRAGDPGSAKPMPPANGDSPHQGPADKANQGPNSPGPMGNGPGQAGPPIAQAPNGMPNAEPGQQPLAFSGGALPGVQSGLLPNIGIPGTQQQVFETPQSITTLQNVNTQSIMEHPLVVGFEQPLPSLSLVETAMSKIPANLNVATGINPGVNQGIGVGAASGKGDAINPAQLIASNAHILRVPVSHDYRVGQNVGTLFSVPDGAFSNWPPLGYIGQNRPAMGQQHLTATINGAQQSPRLRDGRFQNVPRITGPGGMYQGSPQNQGGFTGFMPPGDGSGGEGGEGSAFMMMGGNGPGNLGGFFGQGLNGSGQQAMMYNGGKPEMMSPEGANLGLIPMAPNQLTGYIGKAAEPMLGQSSFQTQGMSFNSMPMPQANLPIINQVPQVNAAATAGLAGKFGGGFIPGAMPGGIPGMGGNMPGGGPNSGPNLPNVQPIFPPK